MLRLFKKYFLFQLLQIVTLSLNIFLVSHLSLMTVVE